MQMKHHENPMSPLFGDDSILKDFEEFEKLRIDLIDEIEIINKRLKHAKDMRKIKKATLKNMIVAEEEEEY